MSEGHTITEQDQSSRKAKKHKSQGQEVKTSGFEENYPHKGRRYTSNELCDLVNFRLEMQPKFETLTTHLELWISLAIKMAAKGYPRRKWDSYRDKWDGALKKYKAEVKQLLNQSGFGDSNEAKGAEYITFKDPLLNEIHKVMHRRPKYASQSRFQSALGGARGPTCGEALEGGISGIDGKRAQRGANIQSIDLEAVDKVIDKMDERQNAHEMNEAFKVVSSLERNPVKEKEEALSRKEQPSMSSQQEGNIDNQVAQWLASIGREKYAANFARGEVDWLALLCLKEVDLQQELIIPIGPARHIWKELQKLKQKHGGESEIDSS